MFSCFSKSSSGVERAIGNGNCAFNAFALGLCRPAILKELQLNFGHPFVVRASAALNVRPASWKNLKKRLLNVSRDRVQTQLAPILRDLAVQRILDDPAEQAAHLQDTLPAMLAEYQSYHQLRLQNAPDKIAAGAVGDIFFRHPLIRQQFEACYESGLALDEGQTSLGQWWTEAGHRLFLERMRLSAHSGQETDLYAGDLELAQLGALFDVNIRVYSQRRHIDTEICRANGRLPASLAAHARTLADRGIIYNQSYCWMNLSRAALQERLAAVPDYALIANYVAQHPVILPNTPVPSTWSEACVAALRERGVIHPHDPVFYMRVDSALLQSRLSAVTASAAILHAFELTYRLAPVIVLNNEYATHWNLIKNPAMLAPIDKTTRKRAHDTDAVVNSAAKRACVAPYVAKPGERDVNDAMNEAFDLLTAHQAVLSASYIATKCDALFTEFTLLLDAYSAEQIDAEAFQRSKAATLATLKLEIDAQKPTTTGMEDDVQTPTLTPMACH